MAHHKGDHGYCLGDTFGWGLKTFFGHFLFFMGVMLIALLSFSVVFGIIYVPFNFFASQVEEVGVGFYVLLMLLFFVIGFFGFYLYLGWVRIQLDYIQKGTSSIRRLFSQARFIPRAFLLNVLLGLMIFFGLIALILPGIYLWCRFYFATYVLLDKDTGVIDALKTSFAMTHESYLALFAYTAASALFSFITLFLLWPSVSLSNAFGYNYLIEKCDKPKKKKNSEDEKKKKKAKK